MTADEIKAMFNPLRYLVTQPSVNPPYFTNTLPDISPDDVVVYDLLLDKYLVDGEWFDIAKAY